tara:strand:+ start:71 stop:688 length:618 start_codon:yes stop_codon:yes gene_type:complete
MPSLEDIKDSVNLFINRAVEPNRRTKGHSDSNSHFITLFAITLALRAKRILELGVRKGGTTLPLLSAAYMIGGHVDSVDIKPHQFKCPAEMRGLWTFHLSDSIEFLEQCDEDRTYRLIFIDDYHTYEHVANELRLIEKLVTPRSIILLHDTMPRSVPYYNTDNSMVDEQYASGGPYRALKELDKTKWEFSTIPVCNGLTMLRKYE